MRLQIALLPPIDLLPRRDQHIPRMLCGQIGDQAIDKIRAAMPAHCLAGRAAFGQLSWRRVLHVQNRLSRNTNFHRIGRTANHQRAGREANNLIIRTAAEQVTGIFSSGASNAIFTAALGPQM